MTNDNHVNHEGIAPHREHLTVNNSIPAFHDLIFSSASQNISKLSASLSKATISIRNRLHSIDEDSKFVRRVVRGEVRGCEACEGLPVVANERCGGWYVDPALKASVEKGSCYFKSTDGHFSQWSFSLRRLNLHVLDVVGDYGGCIIVDSTRRGKHLPDALSKTIPIWCAIINRLIFPGAEYAYSHSFERLPELISASEQAQIEARLNSFVKEAQQLDLPVAHLRTKLARPLKPIWIARSLGLPHVNSTPEDHKYRPIYLCTALTFHSTLYDESSSGYIQGAGDDNESWSRGLTSAVYWANREVLLAATEDELPELIDQCMREGTETRIGDGRVYGYIPQAPWVRIGTLPETVTDMTTFEAPNTVVVACAPKTWTWPGAPQANSPSHVDNTATTADNTATSVTETSRYVHLHCGPGKLGSRDLRSELVKVPPFIEQHLRPTTPTENNPSSASKPQNPPLNIIICCPTGKDLSIGVALTLLCLYTDDAGVFQAPMSSHSTTTSTQQTLHIDKATIKRKLSWIAAAMPAANPARATLQSVNAFLMC